MRSPAFAIAMGLLLGLPAQEAPHWLLGNQVVSARSGKVIRKVAGLGESNGRRHEVDR